MEAGQWFSGENADPILVSLKDGFTATEKAFAVVENHATNENIFDVNFLAAPKREEDVSSSVKYSIGLNFKSVIRDKL